MGGSLPSDCQYVSQFHWYPLTVNFYNERYVIFIMGDMCDYVCHTEFPDKPSYMGSKVARPLNVWTYDPIGRRLSACHLRFVSYKWGPGRAEKKRGWHLKWVQLRMLWSVMVILIPVPSNFHSDPVNPVLSPRCWGQVKGYPLPRTASRYSVDSSCLGQLVFGRSIRSIFTSYLLLLKSVVSHHIYGMYENTWTYFLTIYNW